MKKNVPVGQPSEEFGGIIVAFDHADAKHPLLQFLVLLLEARQTRLATDRQCTHERRAAEAYRQTKLERLREHNVKLNMLQWNASASLL